MKTIASNNLKRNNRVLLPESSLTPALLIRKRYIFIAAHRGLWRLISRLIIRWRGSEQSTTRSDRRDPLLARIDANISRSQSRPLLSSHQLVLLLRFYARLDEDIELLFFIALLRTRITPSYGEPNGELCETQSAHVAAFSLGIMQRKNDEIVFTSFRFLRIESID